MTVLQSRLGSRRLQRLPVRPRHLGVIIDGNRRWARAAGYTSPTVGHRHGAEHVRDLLIWAQDAGIEHVTVYIASADNLRKRESDEVTGLHDVIETTLPAAIVGSPAWQLHLSGDLGLLPESTQSALRTACQQTLGRPRHVTVAIAYDGRQDIVDAVRRSLLRDSGSTAMANLDVDRVTQSLAGGPAKDIDLVIRTSGEHRLSGFCPWQTTNAEIVVSNKMWPAFARRDFIAALQQYADATDRRADQ
ncbi:polyprenyl diphosphate synthase [Demetria terragena]|uniref:polyprenyl diphosphate synthase n=1 Tax=Demetria terragena TaxID=63959 RepID=UPI000365E9D5|nr:polyprenyl diphosphate synthase [Demetria terragena]